MKKLFYLMLASSYALTLTPSYALAQINVTPPLVKSALPQTIQDQYRPPKDTVTHFKTININEVESGVLAFKSAQGNQYYQAPTLKSEIHMNIKGMVANTHFKQTFKNTTREWQHATYVFPLPDNAAINQLTIKLKDRIIKGEIHTKQKATRIFKAAKKVGKKAALLEQLRPNLFTTKVANIPPHETIEVELHYFQVAHYDQGKFSIHIPTTITPRYTPPNTKYTELSPTLPSAITRYDNNHWQTTSFVPSSSNKNATLPTKSSINDKRNMSLSVSLEAGGKLKSIESLNHKTSVKTLNENQFEVKLNNIASDRDFELVWQYQSSPNPQVVNFTDQYLNDVYGLTMIIPNHEKQLSNPDHIPLPRSLTFVLDTSGSMSGNSLTQAKAAFRYAVSTLTAQDTFQVIQFNHIATKLFSSPAPANEKNKQTALHLVDQLNASGGTEIISALVLALEKRTQATAQQREKKSNFFEQVVFITDGSVGNEADIFDYIANNIADKRLFTVGIGTAPNRYFMARSATIGRGSYHYIASSQAVDTEMTALLNKISSPVLTDLKMVIDSPELELEIAPDPIPDVYNGEPIFISYKLSKKTEKPADDQLVSGVLSGQLVQTSSTDAASTWHHTIDLGAMIQTQTITNTDGEIPAVATLHARRSITDDYRELMLTAKHDSVARERIKQRIINHALTFKLVSPFTSFVAVDHKVSAPQNTSPTQEKRIKNNLPHAQKLPQTALGWQFSFKVAVCILLIALLLIRVINHYENQSRQLEKQ